MPPRKKDPKTGKENLTYREKRFIEGIVAGKTIKDAALAAGYSPKTASQIGTENLNKPEIFNAIQKAREDLLGQQRVELREAHGRLAISTRCDVADLFPNEPVLQHAKALGISKGIKKFTRTPTKYGDQISVELYSAHEAIDKLADLEGWNKQAAENPDDAARKREFWAEKIKLVRKVKKLKTDAAARDWLLENVEEAKVEQQWLM